MNYPSNTERKLARAVITTLLDHGFSLGVNDGEEITLRDSKSVAAVMAALGSTDEDWLIARQGSWLNSTCRGVVRFVWGNEEDAISDYSTTLERFIGHIQA